MKAKAVSFCETPAQRRAVRPVTEDKLEEWGILTRRGGKLVAANAFALLSGDKALNTVVKCGIFRGTEHRKLLDSREFGGPIQDQIDAVHEWLLSKINMAAVIKGVYRHDVYEFPEGALRELITNAVMRRNYAVYGSDIQVALYDDRLEIISPGGLPRGMTVQRMLSGCSRCRNKAIAEAFAYMHVAEKWGLGIPNAMHEFVEHGLSAPEYTDWGNAVKVTVRRHPKEPNDTVNDTVDVSLNNLSEGQSHQTSSNNETSQPSNVSLNVPLKSRNVSLHDAIVALVRDNPGINRKNLAFHLKVTVKTIDRLLPS
jgi:predicted HTH transcriptional regulator